MTPEQRIAELGFESVAEYQIFHGLPVTGVVDPATIASLEIPRFCAVKDKLEVGEGTPRWGKNQLTYSVLGALPGIPLDSMKRAAQIAFDRWAAVCDIRASHIKTAGEAADILMQIGPIDGPSGVLAWSELPGNGTTRQLKQMYGKAEAWVIADTVPVGKIDLIRVVCHELGHALGTAHLQAGNLMAPTYSTQINKPQAGDIVALVQRYGQPKPVTPAPPGQPPTGGDENEWVTIRVPKSWVNQN
jgi:hypothetical protein